MKYKLHALVSVDITRGHTYTMVTFGRLRSLESEGRTKPNHFSTPASLRRVCRLLQGQPAFGEAEQVCEWERRITGTMRQVWNTTCERETEFNPVFPHCPFCGRKVVTE